MIPSWLYMTVSRVLTFLILLIGFGALAQGGFESTKIVAPDWNAYSVRFVDFHYTNRSNETQQVLRVKGTENTRCLTSANSIYPDSSTTIRVQINPIKKGAFEEIIEVYFGHLQVPIKLTVSGRMLELPADANVACPDFSNPSTSNSRNFKVVVLDSATHSPIKHAGVEVVYGGKKIFDGKTDKNGEQRLNTPPGYTIIHVAAADYKPNSFADYIGKGQTEIRVYLAPNKPVEMVQITPIENDIEEIVIVTGGVPEPVLLLTDFNETLYAPNNVVFLLDVSSSMGLHERLEILQKGLHSLMDMLRPIDKVSIVTYADNAEVLLSATSGADKATLFAMINNLKAKGSTAGGDGIKLAYEVAKRNYIRKGNNIVILITDGAFNTGDMQYLKYIRRNANRGILMTTIGIKAGRFSAMSLQEVAETAKGRYVAIDEYDEAAQKLMTEIKTGSLKH